MAAIVEARATSRQSASPNWAKIVLWTIAFQFAWNWRAIALLFGEGAMPDADDFMRLQQVRDWMNGQGWFDLVQHRFDPPSGADIHWSRLVDVPIAALIGLFRLFVDAATAEHLALLVWPTLLLLATVLVVIRICMALIDRFNPLLALLLTVTTLTAMVEFMPARIDHHGVQILLFCLVLLGLANPQRRWGHLLVGAAIAASIAIGLDAILLIVLVLAWLGIEWAAGGDGEGRGLMRTAGGMALVAPVLLVAAVAPSDWLVPHCDANSIVYVTALLAISAGFCWLALASPALSMRDRLTTTAVRLGAGALTGGVIAGLLYWLFPQCAAGPYGEISPALAERWMVDINEAMPLGQRLVKFPELWVSGVAYSLFLIAVCGLAVWKYGRARPGLIGLYAALLLSIAAAVIQYRALRIGIFAAIPLCVVFAGMAADWIEAKFGGRAVIRGLANVAVVAVLLAPVWWIAGSALTSTLTGGTMVDHAVADDANGYGGWRKSDSAPFCNRASQYAALAALPPGLVMTDINSGPAVLAFTGQSAVGGPYHRNAAAILDMLDFFETDLDKPKQIAAARGIDYVYFCDTGDLTLSEVKASDTLLAKILLGAEPDWLERLTPKDQRYHLFRVRR